MKNKDRKLCLKVEWLNLELDETNEKMEEYRLEFLEDFEEELIKDPKQIEPKQSHHEFLQKLYRAIAKITHPDLNPDGKYSEIFKRANQAYAENNWTTIISIATELRIELPEFPEDVRKEIEENITHIETDIVQTKTKIGWIWAESNKEDVLREKIYDLLGINKAAFEIWKRSKN